MSLEICYLSVFQKAVKVMGQSLASHNLLLIKEISLWDKQGRQLAYVAYVRTPNFVGVHMILDMRLFIPYDFVKFSNFTWLL